MARISDSGPAVQPVANEPDLDPVGGPPGVAGGLSAVPDDYADPFDPVYGRLSDATPTEFGIKPAAELLRGTKVVLWCRVSWRSQDRAGTLDRQEWAMREWAAAAGFEVVDVLAEECSGRWPHATQFQDAVRAARRAGA